MVGLGAAFSPDEKEGDEKDEDEDADADTNPHTYVLRDTIVG